MADILLGTEVSKAITQDLKLRSTRLRLKGVRPKLAIIRVGADADDLAYERNIEKICATVEIYTEKFSLAADVSQDELMRTIEHVNADDSFHGLMMFRPLPKHLDEAAARKAIRPQKDVDGITDASAMSVYFGRRESACGFPPCTAEACIRMLEYYHISVEGKNVAIIGRSFVVGRPLAAMLISRNATITVCHTKTLDVPGICRRADIIIACAGSPRLVNETYINDRQVILDVGSNFDAQGNMCGDVSYDNVEPFVSAISPVPAGIGVITTRLLAEHTIIAAENSISCQ